MSKSWITAAIAFFFISCCLGGVLVAGLAGPEGVGSEEWKEAFGPRDAGTDASTAQPAPVPVPSSSDAQPPTQP